MNLEEAYKTISVSPAETASIERYLGFEHTGINILADLTPRHFEELKKSGWLLPEKEDEIKNAICDFVNIYSAMYKESKGRTLGNNLIRGTSTKRVPITNTEINQLISTSTDENIAKRFCQYGDAAIIRFRVGEGVPFLDAETYRGENASVEEEVILAPFCKASKVDFVSNYNGYKYYNVFVEKQDLEEKTDEALSLLMSEIISGFSQNISDMKKAIELETSYGILANRIKNSVFDREEQAYLAERQKENVEEYHQVLQKTNAFKEKLRTLLKGMCRKKELEVDRAQDIIDEDKRKRQERIKEEIKQGMVIDFLKKKNNLANESVLLQETLISTYQELIQCELAAKRIASSLDVSFTNTISDTDAEIVIQAIQENVKRIQEKINEVKIESNDSFENVSEIIEHNMPSIDGISYGLEIAKELPQIIDVYQKQADKEIKKNLYMKVQKAIKDAKVQKYLNDRDAISKEGISFLGDITGKNDLQIERLNNVNLKIQLTQLQQIEEKENYSVREMLADLYICSNIELGGNFTPEMKKIYDTIKQVYSDKKIGKFTDEFIAEIAREKIMQDGQIISGENLPIAKTRKSFLEKNKAQTELLRLENQRLNSQIMNLKEANKLQTDTNSLEKNDAIFVLLRKLKLIDSATIDKSGLHQRKNLIQTFDLFS